MLIKKFTSKLTSCWITTLSWRKNNNIYIVEQLKTLHSYICIVAFHLGTIDVPREGCEVGIEPEEGERWTHPEDGRMDPDVPLTNTDLVLIPGKPRSMSYLI